jgi:hypothetical protein
MLAVAVANPLTKFSKLNQVKVVQSNLPWILSKMVSVDKNMKDWYERAYMMSLLW